MTDKRKNKFPGQGKNTFAHEEFANEMYMPVQPPVPRERKSQKAQLESEHVHEDNKAVKVPMKDKRGR